MNQGHVILHLIRHAESLWNVEGRYQGQADSGLTAVGAAQAEALAEWLVAAFPRVDIVAASDLPRVRDTAGPLAAALGVEVAVDPRLREVDIGDWAGRRFDDVALQAPDAVAAAARGIDVRRGGGETFAETRGRVVAAIDELVERALSVSSDAVGLVFTHGGPIRVAAADALGLDSPGHARIGPPANCSVTTIELGSGGRRLLRYNQLTSASELASLEPKERELAGLS